MPWDRTITAYNLAHISHPDIEYLITLNEHNSDQLYEYTQQHKQHIGQDLKNRISERLDLFHEEQGNKTWQEYTLLQFTLKQ